MNHVERFRAVMDFQPVDRLPMWEWAMWWDKTIDRWRMEGLPAQLTTDFDIAEYFGLDPYKQFWFSTTEATIEAAQHHIEGIVSTLDDYLQVLPRLFPNHDRAIQGMAPWTIRQQAGQAVVWITLEGFFFFPRTLMGFEKMMFAYLDQPELIHRINEDLLRFNLGLLDQIAKACVPTFMTIAEDVSYNNGPMISRQHCDEFLAPYYRRMMERVKELGILTIVDSDGDMTLMTPWFQSVGVDGALPLEHQAGVDALEWRRQFPAFRLIGHYDKMVMNKGEVAIRNEFDRLAPLARMGGFIPSVDHQTPPGVSLEEYRVYLRLLREFVRSTHP